MTKARSRWVAGLAACAAVASLAEGGPAPILAEPNPSRVPRVSVFVPPEYPPEAVKESVTAVADVIGEVRADGTLSIDRIEVVPDREDFRKAVREVAPFWMFRPRYDSRCEAKVDEKQLRIWFELKEGQPAISISGVSTEKVPTDPAQDPLFKPVTRVDPIYPREAQRDGREGRVEALVRIAESGEVEEVVIVPGGAVQFFGAAVTDALSRWKFPPGKRYPQCASYEVVFRLTERRTVRFF